MVLIKPKIKRSKSQIRITLHDHLVSEIKAYCEWAGIEKLDDFIEQAVKFVFVKDKAWKKLQAESQVK